MPESAIPKRSQPGLFRNDAIFEAGILFLTEAKFLCDGFNEIADFDSGARREKPKVVKVPRLVACPVLECNHFLGCNFVQAVCSDWPAFWYILKFRIGAQNGKVFNRKVENFRDGYIHLDGVRCRQRSLIAEIEGVAVDVGLAILAFKSELNAGGLSHQFVHFFEPFTDLRECDLPCKREVQVLGKTIVPEVAALERGTALEDEQFFELALT